MRPFFSVVSHLISTGGITLWIGASRGVGRLFFLSFICSTKRLTASREIGELSNPTRKKSSGSFLQSIEPSDPLSTDIYAKVPAITYFLTRGIKGQNFFRAGFFTPNLIGGIVLGYIWQFTERGYNGGS